jgi:biotin transport system permease protein
MISLYIAKRTWLHQLPAGIKLIFLAAVSILLLPIQNPMVLALGCGCMLLAYASLGRVGLARFFGLRAILPLMLGLAIFQALVMTWQAAAVSLLRIMLMIMLADLVTATTPMQAMMRVAMIALSPIRFLGFDPKKLALAVALMIRFIPQLLAQWQAQHESWRARSSRRSGLKLLAPFMNETLRRTDHIAEAILARKAKS